MRFDHVLGRYAHTRVRRFGGPGAFLALPDDLEPDAPTLLLPRSEVPEGLRENSELEVFVYLDSDDRPIATTRTPKVTLNDVRFLTVVDVGRYGAFVDWGLPKDLLVPHAEQVREMQKGERYAVGLIIDKTGRLAGTTRVAEMLIRNRTFQVDEWVEGEAWRKELGLGVFVIIEGKYLGLIPKDEPITISRGYAGRFRVTNVFADGKIELSLRKFAHEEINNDAERILDTLKQMPTLRVSDHSSPEEIRRIFGLSKKAFKRAVGKLFKERAIRMDASGFIVRQF